MKNLKNNKGFTLIELLVVVAIIGILSAVVLASLSTARTRGRDAAIKSALASARAEAEIIADGGSYNTACTSGGAITGDTTMTNIISNITTNSGTAPTCSTDSSTTGAKIEIHAKLATSTSDNWCVDSNGFNNVVLSTAAVQPGSGKCQ